MRTLVPERNLVEGRMNPLRVRESIARDDRVGSPNRVGETLQRVHRDLLAHAVDHHDGLQVGARRFIVLGIRHGDAPPGEFAGLAERARQARHISHSHDLINTRRPELRWPVPWRRKRAEAMRERVGSAREDNLQ